MRQPTFDCNAQDKYSKLKTFRLEVNNILSTYNTPQRQISTSKNWLGRNGLQYSATLITDEKEICNTLEGLFETLFNKFKPQYNETINLLQFSKLYQYDCENVEEWMGRLCVAAVECNYQEVDRQLKKQFMHSLNDKYMLEEIIKELTAARNDDHITSGGVLVWAKNVSMQRAQAAVLNTLIESRQFHTVKIHKRTKDDITKAPVSWTVQQEPCRYCGGTHQPQHCPAYDKTCGVQQEGPLKKLCHSKRSRVVNEMRPVGKCYTYQN